MKGGGGKLRTRRKRKVRGPRERQLHFEDRMWGGRRRGAGRPKDAGSGASHLSRSPLASRFPVHVTLKVDPDLPSLRQKRAFAALRRAFVAGCKGTVELGGFRLVHFSVQHNHVHLLVEGKNREHLSRGLQGLQVRMAKGLNRVWGRKGKVFPERYFEHILRTPLEVKNVLRYVIWNAHKHRVLRWHRSRPDVDLHDPYASGPWLRGWKKGTRPPIPRGPTPVTEACTWLMRVGWKRHGLFPMLS